jgi:hypothetical protein
MTIRLSTWLCLEIRIKNEITELDDSSFERLEDIKYLGTTLKNQNFIQEENKSRLKSGNAYYHSVQNLPSFSLLSKNFKIKKYETIFPLLFCVDVKLGHSQ